MQTKKIAPVQMRNRYGNRIIAAITGLLLKNMAREAKASFKRAGAVIAKLFEPHPKRAHAAIPIAELEHLAAFGGQCRARKKRQNKRRAAERQNEPFCMLWAAIINSDRGCNFEITAKIAKMSNPTKLLQRC